MYEELLWPFTKLPSSYIVIDTETTGLFQGEIAPEMLSLGICRVVKDKIVWQKEILVPDAATQYAIAYHTKKIMSEGLVETLNKLNIQSLESIQSPYQESYHRAPSKEQGKSFHKQGLRVVTFKNAKLTLSKSF